MFYNIYFFLFLMESERYKIKVIGHKKKDGHIHYILNAEKNGQHYSFLERYSNLRGLNDLMKKYTNKPTFPKFPPKKFFGSEDEKFIIRRQQEINIYFENICNDPDFVTLPPFIKFIEEKISKGSPNEKTEPVKKDNIKIDEFKKSIINDAKDCDIIAKEFVKKFYNMKNIYYDKEEVNDTDKFIKFFKNNDVKNDQSDIKIDIGNENNFNLIYSEDIIKNYEENIKNKFKKTEELFHSFVDTYNTSGIIVPI